MKFDTVTRNTVTTPVTGSYDGSDNKNCPNVRIGMSRETSVGCVCLMWLGRVARAGRSGVSYSLVSPDEIPFVIDLHLFLGRPLVFADPSKPNTGIDILESINFNSLCSFNPLKCSGVRQLHLNVFNATQV